MLHADHELQIEQQIEHLKSKGVTFKLCSEKDAAQYLSERTYFFKIAAYRTLFEKRVGGPRDGQYFNLDFGHLKALASLDRDLRYTLLPLTLDIENAARTKLVRVTTKHGDEDGQDKEPPHQADRHVDVPAYAAGTRKIWEEKHGIASRRSQEETARNERSRARQRHHPIGHGFFGKAD